MFSHSTIRWHRRHMAGFLGRGEIQQPGAKSTRAVVVIVLVLQPVRRLFHISGHAVDVDDIREPDIRPFKAT